MALPIETLTQLLVRKAALVREIGGNCTPRKRDAIEQEVAEIDAKLNALDPAEPTPTSSFN